MSRPRAFKLRCQPLEQDVVVLTLRCLGQELYEFREGKCVATGLHRASDGSLFWRANAGSKVIQGPKGERMFRANPAGTADILCIIAPRGLCGGLECKRPGMRQRPAQVWWQRQVEAAGGMYEVFITPNEAMRIVDAWRRGERP